MTPVWKRGLLVLAIIGVAALALLAVFGTTAALLFLVCALVGLYLLDRSYLDRLWLWIEAGPSARVPVSRGVGERLLAMLYKQNRSAHLRYEALAETLARFQKASEALPDGVITLDRENRIIWFNDQARDYFGLKPSDTGHYIANLLRSPDFASYLAQDRWDTPIVLRVRNLQTDIDPAPESMIDRVLSIQLVGYGDAQKLLLSRDVTKIEKLETMRRDFVANVSHELKTPLTVLSGFVETMTDHELPPKQQREYLELMNEQADRMQRLVSDLLTLSALESARSLSEETLDMKAVLGQVENAARQLSQGRHRLEFEIEEGLNLIGAESEIASAFTNLVTNAIRYTPAGGQITACWKSCARAAAKFSVVDTGIGIESQHLPRLTERFYRVDRGRSRESGGTGLGLAIVKHVLTRHQGRLEIESTPGIGSRFTAVLPEQRVVRNDASATPSAKRPSSAQFSETSDW